MIRLLSHKTSNQEYITWERLDHVVSILKDLDMPIDVGVIKHDGPHIDGLIKVNGHLILLECKSQITPKEVVHIEAQLKRDRSNPDEFLMAAADYITPKAMGLLREKGINYLDKVGNMFLKLPQLFIHIDGRKNETTPAQYKSRAFTKTGGAVVFQLLMDPTLVNAPQRQIAASANVSLGTIPKVLNGLKKEGFVIRLDSQSFQIAQYEKLLNKWVDVLKDKILPANVIGNYSFGNQSPKTVLKSGLISNATQWGGEPAAAILQNYLVPEAYTIFTSEKENLIRKFKVIPAINGEITIYRKFWNQSEYNEEYVHPILIYGQLMASGESRNIESAEMIMNEYIRPNI